MRREAVVGSTKTTGVFWMLGLKFHTFRESPAVAEGGGFELGMRVACPGFALLFDQQKQFLRILYYKLSEDLYVHI